MSLPRSVGVETALTGESPQPAAVLSSCFVLRPFSHRDRSVGVEYHAEVDGYVANMFPGFRLLRFEPDCRLGSSQRPHYTLFT